MIELEVKAMVVDPDAFRSGLRAAGAAEGFAGYMRDRRYDREGELLSLDHVLRSRTYDGAPERPGRLTWKGPVSVQSGAYKRRTELEIDVAADAPVGGLLEALGYVVVDAIDRYVEYYELADATVRLEWYPRMDVLVEVEGTPASIEAALAHCNLPRDAFTADPLSAFVTRFERRTGEPAITSEAGLGPVPSSWGPAAG